MGGCRRWALHAYDVVFELGDDVEADLEAGEGLSSGFEVGSCHDAEGWGDVVGLVLGGGDGSGVLGVWGEVDGVHDELAADEDSEEWSDGFSGEEESACEVEVEGSVCGFELAVACEVRPGLFVVLPVVAESEFGSYADALVHLPHGVGVDDESCLGDVAEGYFVVVASDGCRDGEADVSADVDLPDVEC